MSTTAATQYEVTEGGTSLTVRQMCRTDTWEVEAMGDVAVVGALEEALALARGWALPMEVARALRELADDITSKVHMEMRAVRFPSETP